MGTRRKITGCVAAAALVGALAAAPATAATTRYAKPSGVGFGDCTDPNPTFHCEINRAVEFAAEPGDEVILAPGPYIFPPGDSLMVSDAGLNLHGAEGQPRPELVFDTGFSGLDVAAPDSRVHYLQVEISANSGTAVRLSGSGVVGEDLVVKSTAADNGHGVRLRQGATLRDSIVTVGESGDAVVGDDGIVQVRNVTAIGTGDFSNGLAARTRGASRCDGTADLIAKNVIARGGGSDLKMSGLAECDDDNRQAVLRVSFSNYRAGRVITEGEEFHDDGNNQTSIEPLFVDVFGGDYRQAPGSPTIDAGTADAAVGTRDFEGQPRPMGCAPDIGADEFASDPCPVDPGPGNPGNPNQPGAPDTAVPVLASASMTNTVFAVGGPAEPLVSAQARRGTTFRYTLSEPARVVFTIQRALPGRRVRGKCRKPSRANRKKPKCTRWRTRGRFAQQGVAGANTKTWSGKLGSKALRRGRYRAVLVATDAAGNRSLPKRLRFRIVRR